MTTVKTKKELEHALAKLDIPKIVKRTIYLNITLGRTYSTKHRANTVAIPGAREIHIAGELLRTYKAAGMERSRHHSHRTALVRSAQESIKRNAERYRVAEPSVAAVVCRVVSAVDGTVLAIDRRTAAELVSHSSGHQRSLARREEEERRQAEERRDHQIHTAVHDTSGDSRTLPEKDERVLEKIYGTGATYLVAKQKSMDRAKVA